MFSPNIEGKLFAKNVPVSIKDGFSSNHRSALLFLSVEWQETSTLLKKELLITLTDNNDPFFLYNLQMSEDDYQRLKSSQGLLVDFSTFPQKFIEFIEICLDEDNKAESNYLLMGETEGSIASTLRLDVVQANNFKHLTHISLKFLAASESTVKQHLTLCYKAWKEDKRNLQNRLCFIEKDFRETLGDCQATLEKKSQELAMMKEEFSAELSLKERRHSQALAEEKDRHEDERNRLLTKHREEEKRLEKEIKSKENKSKNEIQQLEARVNALEKLNSEIQERNKRQEKTICQLNTEIANFKTLEEKLKQIEDLLDHAKSQIQEKESLVHHLNEQIRTLEDDVYSKRQKVLKLQDELEKYHEKARNLDNDLKDEKRRRSTVLQDRNKANEIIQKLQSQVLEMKEQLTIHASGSNEKDRILHTLRRELEKEKMKSLEVYKLQKSLEVSENEVETLKKEKKKLEGMIHYLNSMLYENGVQSFQKPLRFPEIYKDFVEAQAAGDRAGVEKDVIDSRFAKDTRLENNHHQEKRHRNSMPSPSSYNTRNACTRSPNIIASDKNANRTNLEINSQGLSADFGESRFQQHSTAKKQDNLKSSRIPIKS